MLVSTKLTLEPKIIQVAGSAQIAIWMQDIGFVLRGARIAKNVGKLAILPGPAEMVSPQPHQVIPANIHQPETDTPGPNNSSVAEAVAILLAKLIQTMI